MRDIFKLDNDTIRVGRASFNLLVKALILGISIGFLLLLNRGIGELLSIAAGPDGLDEKTKVLLYALVQVFLVFVAAATIIHSMKDIILLAWHQFTGKDDPEGTNDE